MDGARRLSEPNDSNPSGKFLFGPTRFGLTCATLVLAVFQAAGVPLVKYDEWPVGRPGDADWQWMVVENLRASGQGSAQHLAAMESEIGKNAARFRPEEVAGAATISDLPATFVQALAASSAVLQALSQQ